MNYFILNFILILLFSGCSHRNAFSQFEMQKKKELSVSYLQSYKLMQDDKVKGIMSVIYLNNAFRKEFQNYETFYVSIYLKDSSLDIKNDFYLDDEEAISVEKLPNNNKFKNLIISENSWNSFYLVKFKKSLSKKIKLVLKTPSFSSKPFIYDKDLLDL